MISRLELKSKAKEIAFKNLAKIWVPMLVYIVAMGLISAIFGDTAEMKKDGVDINPIMTLINLLTTFVVIGYYRYLLAIVRNETFEMKEILNYKSIWLSAALLSLLIGIFTFLWTLLLIIPGIIAALSYSMAFYITADESEIEPLDAIEKSKKMMNGHKGELFMLGLSFIGWVLLSIITLGIALIWFLPYSYIAYTLFYEELRKINPKLVNVKSPKPVNKVKETEIETLDEV